MMKSVFSKCRMIKEENHIKVKGYGKEAQWEKNKVAWGEDSQLNCKDITTKVTFKMKSKQKNQTNSVCIKAWYTQENWRLKI